MHIVTFYSFKGGVGRTMALVNAAAELSLRSKRVLIVDFDLEAPGLQSFEPFAESKRQVGVVDYVTTYMQSRSAPDVNKYITECKIGNHSVWLMPAGAQDENYANRLNSIDWLTLYRQLDGFLMFEDLKQQWVGLGFDYVLIDSRTGHTDVGGICTRQLPDATVVMFFPNDQNVSGLEEIVQNIRSETAAPRAKNIFIHFCPSNVPDLDDEEQILQHHFQDAERRLKYKTPASIVHHYQSMALLDQPIFVLKRAGTRLAEEYRRLVNNIVAENIDDKAGALIKLDKIRTEMRTNRGVDDLGKVEKLVSQIYTRHKDDGEVAWSLSLIYDILENTEAQLDTLGIAIDKHANEARARIRRANLLRRDDQTELACDDLRSVISMSDVQTADLIAAIERLSFADSEWLNVVEQSAAIRKLQGRELVRLSEALIVDRGGAQFAAELLAHVDEADYASAIARALALISINDFGNALQQLGARAEVLQSKDIERVFNYACAEWGHSNLAHRDIFERVIELSQTDERFDKILEDKQSDPNFFQCLAICQYVIGHHSIAKEFTNRARRAIANAPPGREFSCWSYLYISKQNFRADLDEMRAQMDLGGNLVPKWRVPMPM
jgi:cellulose biosynthesis protein BcsQ